MFSRVPGWARVATSLAVVGWGANQFAALLPVYRESGHLDASFVSLAFAMYAVGLVPALLAGAELSDRLDRAVPVRMALLLSGAGSIMLAVGTGPTWCLLVGRCLSGAAAGAVLAPGTAWVTDLSSDATLAPRRVAVALSIGFGGGPLVAGFLAQWAPGPAITPYAIHVVLVLGAAVVLREARDPALDEAGGDAPAARTTVTPRSGAVRSVIGSRAFWTSVPLTAPWVFGTATMSFAAVPAVVHVRGYDAAADGLIAGVTLAAGVLVQPLARVLEQQRAGRAMQAALMLAVGGMVLSAIALATGSAAMLLPNAVVLGAAYGVALVSGLRRMETLGHPGDRARLNAVFYALTYVGFAVPLVFTLTTSGTRSEVVFALVGAGVAAATLIQLTWTLRGEPPGPATAGPAGAAMRVGQGIEEMRKR